MSPVPTLGNQTLTLNPLPNDDILNEFSSSDEVGTDFLDAEDVDRTFLAIDYADSADLSGDEENKKKDENANDESQSLETAINLPTAICTAPSTPTGERDSPIGIRRPSVNTLSDHERNQIEMNYQGNTNVPNTNVDENNSLLKTFFGCLKPFFSAVNKFGVNIRYNRDPNSTNNTVNGNSDDWFIPTERIIDDLNLVGSGNEGSVYRCNFDGQIVACKRVKSEEQTNIKHLRKLNHENIIKFRGVSVSPPLFYIVMEFCPYGSLYDILRKRREKSCFTKPTQVLDWAKQVASGINYLHSNRIIHRDIKSPNILMADKNILKISDFGTSKEISNRRSAPMSFNGTTSWMAPELIRSEPCSEKIDVWAFGVVLWEIITCAVPYHNIDPVAVMWGVGKGSLTLPIPSSVPDAFKLLMTMCWKQKPDNRPSCQHILKHLNIAEPHINLFEQEQQYVEITRAWSEDIQEQLSKLPTIDISAIQQMTNDELMKKRQEQLQHIADIRAHYEMKMKNVNILYIQLMSLSMQLDKREQEIRKRERELEIHKKSPGGLNGKKKTLRTILEARKNSIQLIKDASRALHDTKIIQKHPYVNRITKNDDVPSIQQPKPPSEGSFNALKTEQESSNVNVSPSISHETSSTKNSQRRRKPVGHRRTGSKGSVVSWTPPTLSQIAEQEKVRESTKIFDNRSESIGFDPQDCNSETIVTCSDRAPLPTISANVDSKSKGSMRGLNPKTLDLDLKSSAGSRINDSTPSNHNNLSRKCSSSDPEDHDKEETKRNSMKIRRRKLFNSQNSRSVSPSSIASRSNKSSMQDTTTPIVEEESKSEKIYFHEKPTEPRKVHRAVSFHCNPSIKSDRSPSYQTRKSCNQSKFYSSSEEGEVEEVQSDHFVLDDAKHRAKHQDINRKSYGIFSSESENYIEINRHSSSSRNESAFSDEGGHVSDERPASRESMVNSEFD